MNVIRLSTPGAVLGLIQKLEAEGFAAPEAIGTIISNVAALPDSRDEASAASDALLVAIRTGDAAAVHEAALAAVIPHASSCHTDGTAALADVVSRMRDQALRVVILEFPWEEAFGHIASIYNDVAAAMHAAIGRVDPQANPQLIETGELEAWQAVPVLAQRLEVLVGLLLGCYEASPSSTGMAGSSTSWILGMVATPPVDPDAHERAHRAWISKSRDLRGGKYAAIVALGAVLGAPVTVGEFEPWPPFSGPLSGMQ